LLTLQIAVKELRHFKFDKFRCGNAITEDMINQIPAYMASQVQRTGQSYWNDVEGADAEKYN
jgi:hypothetical protein